MLKRWLFGLAIAIGVGTASYGAAASVVVSSVSDPNLTCDPSVTVNWDMGTQIDQVSGARVSDIDSNCEGAQLSLVVFEGNVKVPQSTVLLTLANTGANPALVPFTSPQNAMAITGVSVIIARGSEPAVGPNNACELTGMRIDGWGLNVLDATVSNVRLANINAGCIGNTLLVELKQNGTTIGDASIVLDGSSTGAVVVTLPLTIPGLATDPAVLNIVDVTGIVVSVVASIPDETTTPPLGSPPNQFAQLTQTFGPASSPSNFVSQTQGTTSPATSSTSPSSAPSLVSEVQGARVDNNGGIFVSQTGDGGLLGRVEVGPGITLAPIALAAGILLLVLCGLYAFRRRNKQPRAT